MNSGPKNGWRSIMPLRLSGKSATRFCMFPKVKSASYSPGNSPVYLNVYDLTPINGYVYWAGLGIFHSAVEVVCYRRDQARVQLVQLEKEYQYWKWQPHGCSSCQGK